MKQEEDFDPCAPEDARDFAEFLKAGSPNPFLIYEEHSQIPKLIPETPKFTNMSEEVKPKTAVDLPTEFDSPTFIGASAANSIAVSRFEEAYHSRPPWDIDGP